MKDVEGRFSSHLLQTIRLPHYGFFFFCLSNLHSPTLLGTPVRSYNYPVGQSGGSDAMRDEGFKLEWRDWFKLTGRLTLKRKKNKKPLPV